MRWDALFADLEAQLEAAETAELDAEVADRSRRDAAGLTWADRARGSLGARLTVHVLGVPMPLVAVLTEVASQWLLLTEPPGRSVLVPLRAVMSLGGLGPWSAAGPGGQVAARLGLGSALRGIARERLPVQVLLVDGSTVHGTVDRVGADFVEISELGAGEVRRVAADDGGGRRAVRTVPYAALALVRSSA